MARPLRIQYPGAFYHIMNRGVSRRKIFLRKTDYEEFLKTLSECHNLWAIDIFAYCLMSNHYHVCLRTPGGNLSRVMRHLDGLYTQRFNRAHGRDGPLFRGRYKAILVDADEYLTAVLRYIHLNPVEARLVRRPQEYKWSSHRFYIRPNKSPVWLKVWEVLERFGSIEEFHEFVLSGNEEEIVEFYTSVRRSSVLGGDRFRERHAVRLGKISPEHPRHETLVLRPTVEKVINVVAGEYDTEIYEVLRGRRGRENEARKVGMYLVKQLCDLTLREVAEWFGVGSYGVVGWACHGVRMKIKTDKRLREKIEKIKNRISQQKI